MSLNSEHKWKTYSTNAVARLKEKYPDSVSFEDLMDYVVSSHGTTGDLVMVKRVLQIHNDVDKKVLSETKRYKYYPLHGIAGPDTLLDYLQKQGTNTALGAGELKSVWPTMEEDLTILEAQHKIVVVRVKKDNQAKYIWRDDPTRYIRLDDEFRNIWLGVELPTTALVRKELAEKNFKIAAEETKSGPAKLDKKKKKGSRGTKVTNTHMAGIFKDYSHKRPGAATGKS
jgi:transcription initiation factor TFIIE subunit beta